MYCVSHHISGHLPRQIWFWKISIKTWVSVRPPPPLLGKMPDFFRKWNFRAPFKWTPCTFWPKTCWALSGSRVSLWIGQYPLNAFPPIPTLCFLAFESIQQSTHKEPFRKTNTAGLQGWPAKHFVQVWGFSKTYASSYLVLGSGSSLCTSLMKVKCTRKQFEL